MGTIDQFHFSDVKIKAQRELIQGQIVLNGVKLWDLFEPSSSGFQNLFSQLSQ